MLTLLGPPRGRTRLCSGGTRRDFLRVGALGLGGLTLADLFAARAAHATTPSLSQPTTGKSVVWLWLGGGPTHVETFDPKPDAPAEFRSVTGSVATNLPGVRLGGNFAKMARTMDKMVIVRSFEHQNSGHGGGTHWVMTGYDFPPADNGGGQNRPGLGAIMSKYYGPTTSDGLPRYIRFGDILGDGAAWLGAANGPFGTSGQARSNMTLNVPRDRFADRRQLNRAFDTMARDIDRTGTLGALDQFDAQAWQLLTGDARRAFDVSQEDPRTRDRYGSDTLGQQMLQARRLCEAGAGFVTIHFGGWDMHDRIGPAMNGLAPKVDNAVAAFIEDVHTRGLQDDILLVVTGEFGRTPRINGNAGRDHWAPLSTLAMAGGGLKMGQVLGESSARAEYVKSGKVTPQDLMATVFHVLGIPQALHYNDQSGRPVPMVYGGTPVSALIS